jgi:plasmid stabilization system protein ParE
MYSLIITDIAEEDILNTVEYIADVLKAPTAANDLLDEIEGHEEILENTPNLYPLVPDEYLAQMGIQQVNHNPKNSSPEIFPFPFIANFALPSKIPIFLEALFFSIGIIMATDS